MEQVEAQFHKLNSFDGKRSTGLRNIRTPGNSAIAGPLPSECVSPGLAAATAERMDCDTTARDSGQRSIEATPQKLPKLNVKLSGCDSVAGGGQGMALGTTEASPGSTRTACWGTQQSTALRLKLYSASDSCRADGSYAPPAILQNQAWETFQRAAVDMEEDEEDAESDCFIDFWTPLMGQLSGWKRDVPPSASDAQDERNAFSLGLNSARKISKRRMQ